PCPHLHPSATMKGRRSIGGPLVGFVGAVATFALNVAGGCAQPDRSAPAEAAEKRPSHPTSARTGTALMADTLRYLAAQSVAHPEGNPFLNRARADAIQASLVGQSGYQALNIRHQLADERLRAGQTREAIAELASIMRDAGLTPTDITARNKSFFDLLALAYLRLGEQENCVDNPAANVCILPLAGGARHKKQEGARGAIARYTELLRHFPDDRGSQWLLNIAYFQIGGYPDSVPKQYLIPNLAPRAGDPFPVYPNIAGDVGLAITGRAGGVSIEDFDGDGLLDVFTTSWGLTDPVHLFLADGHGRYVDHTAESGLAGINGGLNTIHADYDNDGKPDILVLRGAWQGENGLYPSSLLHNLGGGRFEDVTFAAGLGTLQPTQTAAWVDFNLDGYLDLFVGAESQSKLNGSPSHRSLLFLNNRDGTFTDVSHQVGIDLDDFVKGVTVGDVNNDGLPDIYVSVIYGRNRLYINKGGKSIKDWRFEERGAAAGVELPINSFPAWFWDYDNDGWDDLLVLSYDVNSAMADMVAREYLGLPLQADVNGKTVGVEPSRLYHNNHDGTFTDVTAQVGLDKKVIYAMGSNYGDLDNDGWLDFYVGTGNPDLRSVIPNRMFRNVGGKRFDEVTLPGGFGHLQKGHAVAFADLDRDGNQDIYEVIGGAYEGDRYTSVLFENPGWPANAWIELKLEGRAANRSAIGARVEVDVIEANGASRTIRRTVGTGGSFGSGPLQLHVGLGRTNRVRQLRIHWPDSARTVTSYADLAVRRTYHITQGEAPVALDRPPVPFNKVKLGKPPGAHQHS
ncbi:MAG: CRTAC1 family protein, partial [Gemmatimonadota bacterium]|nr:CRTAC1 family protein [Gemmatimonadota bacterium]